MQYTCNKNEELNKDIKMLIEEYIKKYLSENNAHLFISAIDILIKLNDIDMNKGKVESWACGIVHAVCSINNLNVKVGDIYRFFNVSNSTGLKRSKVIKELLINHNYNKNKGKFNNKSEIKNYIEDINYINAQKKIKEAYEEKNFSKKVALAKEALNICKDCSDAYIILSNDKSLNNKGKEQLLRKAVEASINILGISDIEDLHHVANSVKEIKPYLGAQYRLANHLWVSGNKKEAVDICMHLLECDPKDRLIIRSILLSWTLLINDNDKTNIILNKYNNDYLTATAYSRALYLIKCDEIDKGKRELRKAIRYNRFVIPYILKMKRIPKVLPIITRFGSEEEAIHYMLYGYDAWRNVPKSINIVKEIYKEVKKDWI